MYIIQSHGNYNIIETVISKLKFNSEFRGWSDLLSSEILQIVGKMGLDTSTNLTFVVYVLITLLCCTNMSIY